MNKNDVIIYINANIENFVLLCNKEEVNVNYFKVKGMIELLRCVDILNDEEVTDLLIELRYARDKRITYIESEVK